MASQSSPLSRFFLCFFFFFLSVGLSSYSLKVCAYDLSISAHPSTLKVGVWSLVINSPKFKPNSVVCERIRIQGYSKCANLKDFGHALKVKVAVQKNPDVLSQDVEICFHKNPSLDLGMCSADKWEKVIEGSWYHSMFPSEDKYVDICFSSTILGTVEVSTENDSFIYEVALLVVGIMLMIFAPAISNSIGFYYCTGAINVGFLWLFMVIFQVGMGILILQFTVQFLHSYLLENAFGNGIYYIVNAFFVLGLILAETWLGCCFVSKVVLCEDASVDRRIACFMKYSIFIFSAIVIIKSSVDVWLAVQALLSCILIAQIVRKVLRPRFFFGFLRFCFKAFKKVGRCLIKYTSHASPDQSTNMVYKDSRNYALRRFESQSFYSAFHKIPDRKKFSRDDWQDFTRSSTKIALEQLSSSSAFAEWANSNMDRINAASRLDASFPLLERMVPLVF